MGAGRAKLSGFGGNFPFPTRTSKERREDEILTAWIFNLLSIWVKLLDLKSAPAIY
jgi:hypothetical protein